jgi:hypothetical protein
MDLRIATSTLPPTHIYQQAELQAHLERNARAAEARRDGTEIHSENEETIGIVDEPLLPLEIVSHILSFLPFGTARLINHDHKKLAERKVRKLTVSDIQESDFVHLKNDLFNRPKLSSLICSFLPITDQMLHSIVQLKSLTFLNLMGSQLITGEGIQFNLLSNLDTLILSECSSITDTGISSIGQLNSLKTLNLTRCKLVTDTGLNFITPLSSLRELCLTGCNLITDIGLNSIAQLSGLKSLHLRACQQINDVGINFLTVNNFNLSIKR